MFSNGPHINVHEYVQKTKKYRYTSVMSSHGTMEHERDKENQRYKMKLLIFINKLEIIDNIEKNKQRTKKL